MRPQKDLMLSRRQKTLSSISNYIPVHILLNRPAGVSFSLTVPKSFTIEQLARQIEAEYAYLVEREVGNSSYPVIECGALFDHVDLPKRNRRRLSLRQRLQQKEKQQHQQQHIPRDSRAPLPTVPPQDKYSEGVETGSLEDGMLGQDDGQEERNENGQSDDVEKEEEDRQDKKQAEEETAGANNDRECHVEESDSDEESASDDDEDEEEDEDEDDMIDEREEAESRGVQLRFSDKVEDVLERDSTVHVVNIDQGKRGCSTERCFLSASTHLLFSFRALAA
ncbi:hypothetical protein BGZ68_005038 [Mortierella alpina]|nr:hypothetical protein BGZ68_005038 [Mortierella alpina]